MLEEKLKSDKRELHRSENDLTDLKQEFEKLDSYFKNKIDFMLQEKLGEIRNYEKKLELIRVDDEKETQFLNHHTSNLTNDKVKIQQHAIVFDHKVKHFEYECGQKKLQKQ